MTLREAFTSEYMSQIKRITLQLRTEATAAGGRRKSRAKGQSVEFSDFRNYVTGDSIKNIDWKSYGRLDKLIIKLFMEERQANVNIVVDTSGSMGFGDKGLTAKLLTACLCYMFTLNMDRVNIYAPGMTPLTPDSGKGVVIASSAYSFTSISILPVVMMFRVLSG